MECLHKLIKCEGVDINTAKMSVYKPDNLSGLILQSIYVYRSLDNKNEVEENQLSIWPI